MVWVRSRRVLAIVIIGALGAMPHPALGEEEEDELPPAVTATAAAARIAPKPALNLYSLLAHDALIAEIERRHLEPGTFSELVERVSRGLVGAPYFLSPLGEAAPPDTDPMFRLDAFDCTTFVETAIALARCDDLREVKETLDRIRYRGPVARFNMRRHLMTSEWIPGLIKDGYLEDVTERVAGKATKWIRLKLDKKRWNARRIAKTLKLDAADVPEGTFALPYVPIGAARRALTNIPPGTVINVVRADVPTTPDVVTHQGLVLTSGDGTARFVRHASPIWKRVVDESLDHFLRRYEKPLKKQPWTVIGLNVLRVSDPLKAN